VGKPSLQAVAETETKPASRIPRYMAWFMCTMVFCPWVQDHSSDLLRFLVQMNPSNEAFGADLSQNFMEKDIVGIG
jgi:hypothetical protein